MKWSFPEAERALRRAIGLNPNCATAHQGWGGILESKGQANEARAETKLAAELDPLSPIIVSNDGMRLCIHGRYAEAITWLDPAFDFATELPRLLELCRKYADREMDLTDACLVRMTELTRRCKIWTVDREDFTAYRRHGRQPVPCEFPTAG